jgi:HlyD family secretion protein
MTTNQSNRSGARLSKKPYKMIGAAVLIVAIGLGIVWFKVVRGGEDPANSVATFIAKRGPLTISVLEAGALKAKDPEIIRNTLEGRATIISIIAEGTRVTKGDLLVELDVSTLADNRIDQVIKVNNAEAAWIDANETRAITKSQGLSDMELAKLTYDFAKLDLDKYRGSGGQYETDLTKAKGDITLNQQELEKNKDYYDWSKKLADEKYLSATQLQADKLTMNKSELNVTVAQNSLKLLEKYTYYRTLEKLKSDVNQADAALDRARAKSRANIAQAEAAYAAKEQEFQRQKDKLAKIDDQITKAKIYAPTEGMVVYATSSRGGGFRDDRKPLADGVEVWERQELIYLPRSTSTVAEVDVHEASLQKVRAGLPAIVTVDALPGKKFMGTVTRIAPLPDPQSMWMNPDLKVYKTEIALEVDDPQLRSGMNCKAEIIVEQHTDTVYVPVQAVLRVGGQPAVYVLNPDNGETEERKVEIGLDDNSMVRIASGLKENEHVLLTPPLKAGAVEPGSRLAGIRGADANEMTQQINEKLKAANDPTRTTRRQRSGDAGQGGPGQTGPGAGAGDAGQSRSGRRGGVQLSAEQMQAIERIKSLPPEEQQKEMEKMKQQFMQRRGQGGGGQGDAPGQGQGQGQGGGRGSGGGGGRSGRGGGQGPGQGGGQ